MPSDPDADHAQLLTRELGASPGSFIAGLRFELRWDSAKFSQLCAALHAAAKTYAGNTTLPRDLSQLFWYCGTFLPRWLDQRDFRVGQPHVDYDKASALLKRLGDAWFGDDCLLNDSELAEALSAVSSPAP
jgi:hypothetical protein